MSTLYNLEPQPTAKILIHTTSGDILLELFAQQTPVTSRNFLQHCLDSYYDNTVFHRLVPGFIVQGGDPTGTGHGGESSLDGGLPFEDEFHSRLKFNRRGLLGMANSGDKNDNGSQFFLTLGKTEELNGRNTMFGRVVGDTIFNLVKMGEAELTEEEGSERPMFPTKVTGTEVLVNPFEGMVRRAKQVQPQTEQAKQPKKKVTAAKKKAGKALLSFGGDDSEEVSDMTPIAAAKKANPKLFDAPAPAPAARPPKRPISDSTTPRAAKRRASSSSASSRASPPPAASASASKRQPPTHAPLSPSTSPEPPSNPTNTTTNTTLLSQTNAQIAALKSSLQRNVPTAGADRQPKQSALEAMIPTGSIRGRKRKKPAGGGGGGGVAPTSLSRDEQSTLDSFNAFRRRLENADASTSATAKPQSNGDATYSQAPDALANSGGTAGVGEEDGTEEAKLCDLHFIANCQSCSRWDDDEAQGRDEEEDDDGDGAWMTHQLTFAKDRLGKDLEWKRQNEQELVVIDPKERERTFKEERKKGRKEGKTR